MPNRHKRKQPHLRPPPSPPSKSPKTTAVDQKDPYPNHPRPTPQECRSVRNDLLAFHGFPKEFAKYRSLRPNLDPIPLLSDGSVQSPAKTEPVDGGGPVESVLDGLVNTILSQNTTDLNSQRAFASLKSAFPTWEDVLAAESKALENAIRCGGLATTKAACIKNLLSCLLEKKGKLCLEYLRELSVDEIKSELSLFKGIGPKTGMVLLNSVWSKFGNGAPARANSSPFALERIRRLCFLVEINDQHKTTKYSSSAKALLLVACVLMFQLQQDDFPVDTHIAKAVGWVPEQADTKKTYVHLNRRIPNELKFDLNCLLFTHGKLCRQCTKGGGTKEKSKSDDNSCPLLNYCHNSKSEFDS